MGEGCCTRLRDTTMVVAILCQQIGQPIGVKAEIRR